MTPGKQIRLFLADGTAGGLVNAEIMNWTGHVATASRSDIGKLLSREEAKRTGIYLLLGDDPDSTAGTAAYVGEGDEIATRLRQHARSEDQGGKDFWDRVIIVTSKDANLTKAHARYLEARLIGLATAARRARLMNGTAPPLIQLPEADISDMEYFIGQMLIVLPVLGVNLFRQASNVPRTHEDPVEMSSSQSPEFQLKVPRHAILARAREIDGEFTVLQGSIARGSWEGTDRHPGYQRLHDSLIEDGSIALNAENRWAFTRDVAFASPSAAGAVVTGRSSNGRTAWQSIDTGQTFGGWQARDIPEGIPEPNAGLELL
jgi:hypothetical protein